MRSSLLAMDCQGATPFLYSQPHHRLHNGFLTTNPHRRRRASRGQLDCPGPVLLLPRRLASNRLCVCALHRRLGVKLLHPQRRRCLFSIRRLLLQEWKLSIPRRLHRQVVEFVQMPKVLHEPRAISPIPTCSALISRVPIPPSLPFISRPIT